MNEIFGRDVVHAFVRDTHVELAPTARGVLDGFTFGLKDIYDIAGYRTGFGNPDWLRTHAPAERTASVAEKLLNAGATLVGKTHTEEMAFSLTGENAHYATPINVAAPGRVPGGSSSGSAAAVTAGLVDFAIGSDTGGSVRGPASFCGIYGIRTTHGRIALDGVCALAPSFDTCGWFARSASVLARVGEVLLSGNVERNALSNSATAGDAPRSNAQLANASPQRRGSAVAGPLLVADDAFAYVDADVAAALAPAVARVTTLLGRAKSVELCREGFAAWYNVFRVIQYDEIWNAHGEWITEVKPTFGPQMITRFDAVRSNDQKQSGPNAGETR